MRETAVFAYVVAILIAVAIMVYTFIALANGRSEDIPFAMIPASFSFVGLWCLGHWIESKNT